MTEAERPNDAVEVSAETQPEVNQPGIAALREAVANQLQQFQRPRTLRSDALAGLSSAISNVPDGMANGVLVGVSPAYGLYAAMAGPALGGALASTQLMMITTTAAASLTTSQALANVPETARGSALAALVLLVGVAQIVFGVLGLGRLTRFVSYSVTTGFLTGVSALLILNQLPIVSGYEPAGSNRLAQALDLLRNLGEADLASAAMAGLTLALAILLPRTRLGSLGRLAAIVVPSLLVVGLGLESVQLVRDVGAIPRGLPALILPSLSELSFDVITSALAVAAVILVQGAGVSQSVPNPDGAQRSMSRDFIAQGAANVGSGLLGGLPIGGSLSATALNVIYGARSRWATVLAGVWMAVIVLALPGLVSYVAMPALGALLILAGASGLKPGEMLSIWKTGWPSRLAIVTTLLATLFLPIQVAVGLGVVLSALLYLNRASTDVSVVELVRHDDGRIEERRPPKRLPSNAVTVLDVYGHLFYAGAQTLRRLLPDPNGAENAAVILRLRGRTTVGATLVDVLTDFAGQLRERNGRLYLSGISSAVHDQLERTGKVRLEGPVRVFEATGIRGESTHAAYEEAQSWLVGQTQAGDDDGAARQKTPQSQAPSQRAGGEQ